MEFFFFFYYEKIYFYSLRYKIFDFFFIIKQFIFIWTWKLREKNRCVHEMRVNEWNSKAANHLMFRFFFCYIMISNIHIYKRICFFLLLSMHSIDISIEYDMKYENQVKSILAQSKRQQFFFFYFLHSSNADTTFYC